MVGWVAIGYVRLNLVDLLSGAGNEGIHGWSVHPEGLVPHGGSSIHGASLLAVVKT